MALIMLKFSIVVAAFCVIYNATNEQRRAERLLFQYKSIYESEVWSKSNFQKFVFIHEYLLCASILNIDFQTDLVLYAIHRPPHI